MSRVQLAAPIVALMLIVAGCGGSQVAVQEVPGEPVSLTVPGTGEALAPSPSALPWAIENLRFCPWCDQMAQKDLNDCPTCGRRMGPLAA